MLRVLIKNEIVLFWINGGAYISGLSLVAGAYYFYQTYIESFRSRLEQYQAGFLAEADLPSLRQMVIEPYFATLAFLLVFLSPILFSFIGGQDRRSGLQSFLFSLPVRNWELVLSRYLATVLNQTLLLLNLCLPLLLLLIHLNLPLLPWFLGILALFVLICSYAAVGMVLAQVITQPLPLAVTHLVVLLVLYFIHAVPSDSIAGYGHYLRALSPTLVTQQIVKGWLSISQLLFFVGVVVGSLLFCVVHMRQARFFSPSKGFR